MRSPHSYGRVREKRDGTGHPGWVSSAGSRELVRAQADVHVWPQRGRNQAYIDRPWEKQAPRPAMTSDDRGRTLQASAQSATSDSQTAAMAPGSRSSVKCPVRRIWSGASPQANEERGFERVLGRLTPAQLESSTDH
jgi:hypothetical protein